MLLQQFEANWKKHFAHLSTTNCHLLVAVSGGIDSVVLVHLLSQSHFSFSIAHCNFMLRGDESKRDEAFVKELAQHYEKPFFVNRFDTEIFAEKNKLSIQEAARKLRYDWFTEVVKTEMEMVICQSSIHNLIVTAHHANDNIETLLINFFRGTGISGLHGILPKQNNLIRPLLFAKRNDIENWAKQNALLWVEDSSNATDNYTRNFFRHQLLPLAKEAFVNVEDNLLYNIQ
ncbi:MAG: tRNA lysidine(34) synthetase TilS, partial [Bacteroidota bacterium]|nr:tRNA lysidine(34) synthetase TilS [Bacteroidota bacterium]